jgi:hypothetical protein
MEFDEEALLAQIMESVSQPVVVTSQEETIEHPQVDLDLECEGNDTKSVCPVVGEDIFWKLSAAFYKKVCAHRMTHWKGLLLGISALCSLVPKEMCTFYHCRGGPSIVSH